VAQDPQLVHIRHEFGRIPGHPAFEPGLADATRAFHQRGSDDAQGNEAVVDFARALLLDPVLDAMACAHGEDLDLENPPHMQESLQQRAVGEPGGEFTMPLGGEHARDIGAQANKAALGGLGRAFGRESRQVDVVVPDGQSEELFSV